MSFCIPVYNSEKWIGREIETILNCKHKNFEIVLYYDKSEDNTLHIIKSYKDTRIRVVYNQQRTAYGQMLINCITSGHGKYCMYVIDRNLLLIQNVDRLLDYLELNNVGCGLCKPINNNLYQIFQPGFDSIKNFSYQHNHIVGIFYNNEMLEKAVNSIKGIKFYNFSPEYLYAACCMQGVSVEYDFCYHSENFFSATNNISKSTKKKIDEWYTLLGNINYMYWNYRHLSKLGLNKKQKRVIQKNIFKNTLNNCTVYYKSLMTDYAWCSHYNVTCRCVSPFETFFNRIVCSISYLVFSLLIQ